MFKTRPQLCASSACISGYVLFYREQINKQLCWINLATVVAGLMKSKLTESQHINICKPINLLNKKKRARKIRHKLHAQLNKKMKKKKKL